MSEHESAAMWSHYADRGVAICSTYEALIASLDPTIEFYAGTVKYIDYATEVMPGGNAFWPLIHKRQGFESERELRFVSYFGDPVETASSEPKFDPSFEGPAVLAVKADLASLPSGVYVSPTAPPWFAEVVKSVLRCYGLASIAVTHSDLLTGPVF
jgi:hypothetical protein